MLAITDAEKIGLVKNSLKNLLGFDWAQYSETFLLRRLEVRLRAKNINSFEIYNKLLIEDDSEKDLLKKELSIHVTNFFRDKEMWSVFKDKIIPLILDNRAARIDKDIKIWCAGCSTGEEPITIAICFKEAINDNSAKIRITATDIDAETIAAAIRGEFEERQFREMSSSLKDKYFDKTSEGLLKANQDLMSMIDFGVSDIFSASNPKNLDIIFCRNTVIYFSQAAKEKLYEDFYSAVRLKGFLIIGKTEMLLGKARDMFSLFDSHERIYRKEN